MTGREAADPQTGPRDRPAGPSGHGIGIVYRRRCRRLLRAASARPFRPARAGLTAAPDGPAAR